MDMPKPFALFQDSETPAFYEQTEGFHYRVAYSRSTDSRNNNELGQDYLTSVTDGQRFAFAICDGVSQSFYGELAARILGDKLLKWVWNLNFGLRHNLIQENLRHDLDALTNEASQLVLNYPIPDHVAFMLRNVLDKKRIIGSEAMFICGLIDLRKDIAGFTWMGDSRLRLWKGEKELLAPFTGLFKTSERWSTVKGPIGELHFTSVRLSDFDHLTVYSDGFSYLDTAFQPSKVKRPFSNHAIDEFIADAACRPSSDDISFLEVWTIPRSPQFPKDAEILVITNLKYRFQSDVHFLFWDAIVGATEYEIRISTENKTTLVNKKVVATEWRNDDKLDITARFISVRAWQNQEPGYWSNFLPIENASPTSFCRT